MAEFRGSRHFRQENDDGNLFNFSPFSAEEGLPQSQGEAENRGLWASNDDMNLGPDPNLQDGNDDVDSGPIGVMGKLDGSYDWKKVGNSYVAHIDGLYVYAVDTRSDGWGSFRFDEEDACVTLPSYNLKSPADADYEFNLAWNNAVTSLVNALNKWYPGSPDMYAPTGPYAQKYFEKQLNYNLYNFNSGSSFSAPNMCPGIPISYAIISYFIP